MSQQERQLVGQCRRQDQAALAGLHAAHAPAVHAYLTRSGFAHADADELTQDVFIRVFGGLEGFDDSRGSLRGWIAAIARNVARRAWQKRAEPANFDPELAQEVLAAPPNPHPGLERQEELSALHDCIERLPAELATVIRLRYVQSLSTRGLAQHLEMPEATVRLRLEDARGRLEDCMKSKGHLA